jgi:hypothetical protein
MIGYETMRVDPPGAVDPFRLTSKRRLAEHMLRGYMQLFTPQQISRVLAPQYRVPWQDILDEWFSSVEQIDEESLVDVCLTHMTDYSHQRRIRPRIDQARWFCLPFYPYMDERVYEAYYRLPLEHLKGDRAHLALLCSYKSGLENLPSASHHLRLPIRKQYRYRSIIRLGVMSNERLVSPLRQRWHKARGIFNVGQSALRPEKEAELQRFKQYDLFNWPEIQSLMEEARRGIFTNQAAIRRLINPAVVDDFLFGSGFAEDRALQFLGPTREIHIVSDLFSSPAPDFAHADLQARLTD